MAIKLRPNETVQCEANFHWTTYLIPGIWAGLFGISLLGQILIAAFPQKNAPVGSPAGGFLFTVILGFGPLLYVWLRNKNKAYVVTNERLYIEEGILSKTKADVPLNKINDIAFSQGLGQRMFGSGNISIMTGNDKPNRLKDLDKPEDFRETLSRVCQNKAG